MPNNEICISGESEGNEMLKYAPNENRGSHSSPMQEFAPVFRVQKKETQMDSE